MSRRSDEAFFQQIIEGSVVLRQATHAVACAFRVWAQNMRGDEQSCSREELIFLHCPIQETGIVVCWLSQRREEKECRAAEQIGCFIDAP